MTNGRTGALCVAIESCDRQSVSLSMNFMLGVRVLLEFDVENDMNRWTSVVDPSPFAITIGLAVVLKLHPESEYIFPKFRPMSASSVSVSPELDHRFGAATPAAARGGHSGSGGDVTVEYGFMHASNIAATCTYGYCAGGPICEYTKISASETLRLADH